MTLDQLKYAIEVMRTKQISKAAENCNISQPSLSVQIANLENELGYKLFVRHKHGVEITTAGIELLKQAQLILDQAENLKNMALDLKGEIKGQLRIGIIPSLGSSLLPYFLKPLLADYPKLEISLTEETTNQLIEQIDSGKIDCAILSTPAKCPPLLIEKVLFYEPFWVFASRNHSILNHKNVSITEISHQEILLLDEAHCMRDQVLQLCKGKEKDRSKNLKIESSSLQTLVEVIRNIEGYTLLPALALDNLTTSEIEKNARQFAKPYPARKISLVYHKTRNKKTVVNALAGVILKSIPKSVYQVQNKHEVRVLSASQDFFEI